MCACWRIQYPAGQHLGRPVLLAYAGSAILISAGTLAVLIAGYRMGWSGLLLAATLLAVESLIALAQSAVWVANSCELAVRPGNAGRVRPVRDRAPPGRRLSSGGPSDQGERITKRSVCALP